MDYGLITIKLITGFIGLWLMTRVLGKKEISQLTPFDFVSSLMLSELVGNTVYQKDVHYGQLLFGLAVWFILSYLFEKVTQYARRTRGPLEGTPSILIHNGKVDMREMKKNRLDFEQLRMMLRQKDIFSLREVAYAIFETNGSLSVLKNADFEAVQKQDLDLDSDPSCLTYNLLEDGDYNDDKLQQIGKDRKWLAAMLKEKGFSDPGKLAYVEWEEGKGLYILQHNREGQAGSGRLQKAEG
ncbi:uncharacterized membrane protein YcaP (DUF421 family) [Paenibacillus rhizosphaerae]|uniref:Uncharacterized membrane protein YcaP (DUF421 family) n=1 Tax=Paenibacillus rhizosphaerae TaxID=297318 RepID=A0A839TUK8_9BACL|nr:DUF421 domain-containing protein [Paenibacillus rhizosphaerae]MBB3130221.1 uncharacterized membrane protein YcaP (DUF421 family) [Paenibacillus rhizosphaerae]